jgi:hypothetical protein
MYIFYTGYFYSGTNGSVKGFDLFAVKLANVKLALTADSVDFLLRQTSCSFFYILYFPSHKLSVPYLYLNMPYFALQYV